MIKMKFIGIIFLNSSHIICHRMLAINYKLKVPNRIALNS